MTIPRLLSSPPGRLARWVYRLLPLSARQRRRLARLSQRLLSPVVVERHLASVPDEILRAAFPETGTPRPGRLLFVDRFLPTPDRMASGLRTIHLVRIARELGAEVTFASAADRDGHRGIVGDGGDGGDGVDRYLQSLAEIGVPALLGERALLTHLREQGREYGLVLLAWPDLTAAFLPLVRALAPGATVAYDTVDLHGLRIGREAAIKRSRRIAREAERYRRLEALIA
ncbi:MAG TPA: hypothetical protein VLA75_04970, partial [Thermoanaerobaculia bacterium]|nr:hypothetical protein [Thermoanaerobaculia bacterium]